MREDLSEHLAPLGTLTYAQNVRFPQSGEAIARPGTRALSGATSAQIVPLTVSNGPLDYLQGCPGGFLFGCSGFGFRYDFVQGRVHVAGSYANALPLGKLVSMAHEELQPTSGTAVPWPLSQAYSAGYIAVMYSGGNGQGSLGPATDSWFCQIYTEDGTLVSSLHQFAIGTASAGWVVADGSLGNGGFVVIKQDGVNLYAAPVDLSASGAVLGAFVLVGTLFSAVSYWAACDWPGIGWGLTYQSAALNVQVSRMVGTGATGSQVYNNTGVAPISVYGDSAGFLYVGYVDVNFAPGDCVARARVYDSNAGFTLSSGGAAIEMCRDVGTAALTLGPPLFGTSALANTAFCVVGRSQGPGIYGSRTRAMTLTSAGALVSAGTDGDIYGVMPVSAPFNGGMYWARFEMGNGIPSLRNMLLDYQVDRAGTSYLKNPKVAMVTEQFVNLQSSGYPGGLYRHHLGTPAELPLQDAWVVGLPRVVRLETHLSTSQGLTIAEWIKFSTEARRVAPAFQASAIVPGDPVVAEHPWGTLIDASTSNQGLGADIGFYAAPTGSASPSNTGPGALNVSSNYQYRIVIERIASNGERLRSAPSSVIAMTTGAADDTGTITGLYPSNILRSYVRGSSAFDPPIASKSVMHVYRTQAGAASAGATFYRCTPPQGAPVPAAGTATYVDQLSDANLVTREILYTDGGVLNNDHPPSCRFVSLSEDRMWLGGLLDTDQLQSSKIKVPGEGFQFSDSPAFRVVLPAGNTGIASMDGAVVAFTKSAIYAVQGGGPTDQGQGAWDTPRVITRSSGCTNGQSVLETSSGAFFQSDRGIEILPRGFGEPVFIGAGVQDSITLGAPVDNIADVKSAAVISSAQTRTARFCIGGPYVLVYDLDTGGWSVDKYPQSVLAICDTDDGAILALEDPTTGGFGFYQEVDTLTTDNGVAIPCELQWAGIHPFGIAGWGRFNDAVGMFAKGEAYAGSCTLELETGWFTKDTSSVTFAMSGMADPDFRQIIPAKMDGSYVRPRLTTTAGGWRFMGWTLDVDDHGGSRRMAAEQRG